jgi:hypothetical protein
MRNTLSRPIPTNQRALTISYTLSAYPKAAYRVCIPVFASETDGELNVARVVFQTGKTFIRLSSSTYYQIL